jgi:hypothetical protein
MPCTSNGHRLASRAETIGGPRVEHDEIAMLEHESWCGPQPGSMKAVQAMQKQKPKNR